MIIYKVKLKVGKEKEEEWFKWMKKTHIPDVINTGNFTDYTFTKLLENGMIQDHNISIYEIQYVCKSWEAYSNYISNYAPSLRQEHQIKYGEFIVGIDRGIYEDVTETEPEEMAF